MPSLSINSKDLDSLGLNLKDLLKAISQTKSSPNDVIKIKKKKKRVKKTKKNSGLSKASSLNPFPQTTPKFTQYPQTGGGGSGFPLMTRVEVRNPDPQTQQQRQDELARQQQQQLQTIQTQAQQQLQTFNQQNQQQLRRYQTQMNRNLQQIQNQTQQQLNDVDRTQRENRRLLGYVADVAQRFTGGQNNPPPANLNNADGNTLMRNTPQPPDRTDRFGIVATNNPMAVMRANNGTTETPVPEYPAVYPENQGTTEDNPMATETFDRLTQSADPMNEWEDIPEDLPLIGDELPTRETIPSSSVDVRVTKRRGRPKKDPEEFSKPKNPVGRPRKVSLPSQAKVSIVDMMRKSQEPQPKTPNDTPRKLIRGILNVMEDEPQEDTDVPDLVTNLFG